MTGKRVVFTGGTGKAGRHVLPHLIGKGYELLNVDLKPFDHPGIHTLIADLTDSGQAFNALTTHFGFDRFKSGKPPLPPDAVVHFAAIPRVLIEPDNETFRQNTISTYNVIEAAAKLGVRKIVIASSETTYGVCFAEGDKDFHSFPLDRDLRRRSDGFLRTLQGRERKDRAGLCHALRHRHLCVADRQRLRAA
jgi:nucleoside-diphosphate-sugar epimerase